MAVRMLMLVFWVVTPCGRVSRYQRFRGTYCLHVQGWYLPTSPHSVTTWKTDIDKNYIMIQYTDTVCGEVNAIIVFKMQNVITVLYYH
jgi:hypothetical protein